MSRMSRGLRLDSRARYTAKPMRLVRSCVRVVQTASEAAELSPVMAMALFWAFRKSASSVLGKEVRATFSAICRTRSVRMEMRPNRVFSFR